MSSGQMTTCPHCETSFHIGEEQLRQAGGRVRCGNCLQVFDGNTGEIEFVPPVLPEETESHPLADIRVLPMAQAELPRRRVGPARVAAAVAMVLALVLLAQLGWQQFSPPAEAAALSLDTLVIRRHPDVERALRLDAVIQNRADMALPYPVLLLSFSSRHGEPRAERLFQPEEYLHGRHPAEIPPRSEIQVSLSLQDPGHDAVNYLARLQSVIQTAH